MDNLQMLLRPDEAARALGIGRSKLFELLAAGELPVLHIGRATRIPKGALERWIETHTVDCRHDGDRGLR